MSREALGSPGRGRRCPLCAHDTWSFQGLSDCPSPGSPESDCPPSLPCLPQFSWRHLSSNGLSPNPCNLPCPLQKLPQEFLLQAGRRVREFNRWESLPSGTRLCQAAGDDRGRRLLHATLPAGTLTPQGGRLRVLPHGEGGAGLPIRLCGCQLSD